MLALYIILGVLLFLFLLMLFPVRLDIGFREEFSLAIGYLFLRIPILPGREKAPKEEKPPKEKKKGEEGEEKKGPGTVDKLKSIVKRKGFFGFVESLLELVKLLVSSSVKILKHLHWRRFDLYLCVGGKYDAAAAAVLYGELSAAVYTACGTLFSLTRSRQRAVTVDLNYDEPENTVDFSARLSLRPIHVVIVGFSLLIKGIPILWSLIHPGDGRKSKGKVNTNERKQQGE